MVVRRRTPGYTRLIRRTWQAVTNALPTLTYSEHEEVHWAILPGSASAIDFYTMIGLAALLAALGLLLNSPAVMIGAMLVAPLMSAVRRHRAGGDRGRHRAAAHSPVDLTPGHGAGDPGGCAAGPGGTRRRRDSRDHEAVRAPACSTWGSPGLGAAAAYALCRKELSAALPGVAIAGALVPPLATAGIGIALGQWTIAGGAMLLYLTNLVAIAAAGNLVFLLLGFAPPAAKKQQRRTLQRGSCSVLCCCWP